MELTRSDEGTLHGQLFRTLVKSIEDKSVEVGDRLPTEAELAQQYAVSRTTARRALDELRRMGYVERRPGLGTFVSTPRLNATIPHLHSVTAEIEQLGYKPGSRLVSLSREPADPITSEQLRIGVGDVVLNVRRVRTADERPFYFAESRLNIVLFPRLGDADYTDGNLSLYKLFERLTGRAVERVTQWFSAVPAPGDVAALLECKKGAPVLLLERVLFVEKDCPVETVKAYFHGETYKYYSEHFAKG